VNSSGAPGSARAPVSVFAPAADSAFALEPATAADLEPLLALRLRAMRESLERLGRYDAQRARERFAQAYAPEHTWHIVVGGARVGFLVLKRLSHAYRLEQLAIDPPAQRRGIGSAVLRWVCEQADRELLPVELVALKGSDANRFYLRHGFVEIGEGEWDIDYLRQPLTASARVVRALWTAFQARDWVQARALLHDRLQVSWWASGERFDGADAYLEANARYPEGWTIHLLEVGHLQDGRVMSLVRVDHPPRTYFATSWFRLDDGRVTGLDEYWASVEEPPAWRDALAGRSRFDPRLDARARVA
jgi:ribosomal protein S18 acetylase RimI-like enzyme